MQKINKNESMESTDERSLSNERFPENGLLDKKKSVLSLARQI